MFQNLLSNSLKYRNKERPPEIRISAALEGAEWVIAVEDNGIGFDQKYTERIFGLFKRFHSDDYPGTGLGPGDLSVHCGTVWRTNVGGIRARQGSEAVLCGSALGAVIPALTTALEPDGEARLPEGRD